MRIAVANSHHACIGGAETYLEAVIPALAAAGHQIAFFSELASPPGAQPIRLPQAAPSWCTSEAGMSAAFAALAAWHPDVIYAHGMNDLPVAARIVETAPAVLFATAITAPASATTRCSPRRGRAHARGASDGDAWSSSIPVDAAV